MPALPPWLDNARPHPDIANGSFDESLFAANLGLVARGEGPEDYLDPVEFAAKTFLTGNLKAALVEIGKRLHGEPAALAVQRLQTEFGGGKTHTLLAAYHLFGGPERVGRTRLVRDLTAALGIDRLPRARVIVLDGSAMLADPEEMPDGTVVHSFLGHLAWQLGGSGCYEVIRAQDEGLRGTSTLQLLGMLREHSPCLILMDETLEYLNKTLEVRSHEGSLAGTTLTVIKELADAVSNAAGVCLLATLTSSRLEDYATVAGEEMQERLSRVVGRTENIITPVEGDDIFPILHRRLFETVGEGASRRAVADAFGTYYEDLGDVLPGQFRDAGFRDRIEAAYPFHPELIDILTNRWGSLSGFQRTRGALRTLAHTVKALSQTHHQAPLIRPGDVPLSDAGVRAEIMRFAGESYKAALNADIIRPDSRATTEDRRRGGEVAAHHVAAGLATTAFLNSFGAEKVLGASAAQMLIGVGLPGLSRGVIEDVRDAFKNAAWYLRYEGGRYRFTTEPNLNKVILEREGVISEERIIELLNDALHKIAPQEPPWRVERNIDGSLSLPDDARLTLGIIDHRYAFAPTANDQVEALANDVLTRYGDSGRTNRNAAVLVAADDTAVTKARAIARTLAAMSDLNEDTHRIKRFNEEQREDLAVRISRARDRLPAQLVMAYRHLFQLGNGVQGRDGVQLEHIDLGPARVNDTITGRVNANLQGTDRLLDTLAPAALLSSRFALMPDDQDAMDIQGLLAAFHRYPRLPKITSPDVLRSCLVRGAEQGVFALVSGSSWDAPDAVIRWREAVAAAEVQYQPGIWLVRAGTAQSLIAARASTVAGGLAPPPPPEPQPGSQSEPTPGAPKEPGHRPQPTRLTIRVNAVPTDKARDVLRTAVLSLAAKGVGVTVDFVVDARATDGIPHEVLDLVVREGLRQLGVDHDIRIDE